MTLRRYSLLLGLVLNFLVLAACRYEVVWTGVEFDESGETIRLASAEPLCGCLQITNISGNAVHIRSSVDGRELGTLDLPSGQSTRVHFDWAGSSGPEYYVLDTWLYDGRQVNAQDVLRIDETGWPWQPCTGSLPGRPAPPACEVGPLKLDTGRGAL